MYLIWPWQRGKSDDKHRTGNGRGTRAALVEYFSNWHFYWFTSIESSSNRIIFLSYLFIFVVCMFHKSPKFIKKTLIKIQYHRWQIAMLSGIEVAHSWSEEFTLQIFFAYFSDYFVKQREKKMFMTKPFANYYSSAKIYIFWGPLKCIGSKIAIKPEEFCPKWW